MNSEEILELAEQLEEEAALNQAIVKNLARVKL
jgi:hypothetical protein